MIKTNKLNSLLCLLLSAALILIQLNSGCGGGGGGVSGTPVPPAPHPVAKLIEINGTAGPEPQSSPASSSAAYQINFLTDYTISASDINGNAIAGASGVFLGATSFKVIAPLGASSKILMLGVKHKSGNIIFKKLIGKMPASTDIAEDIKIIKITNARINEDSTVKALVALSEPSKIPDILINSTETGKTDFEAELDMGLNDDDGSQYINQLKTVFNTIVKVLNSSNIRMQSVRNYFLTDLKTFLNSYVEVGQIYQSDENIKQLLNEPPEITIKSVSINFNSRPAEINTAAANITSSVTAVAGPPVFSPASGLYKSAQSVIITSATEGASIKYTEDGSQPSRGNGNLYSSPIKISAPVTLKAFAFKDSMRDSKIASANYIFDIPVKPSSPLVLNNIAAGASAFELKNIYDNGQPLTQSLNTLNPYFEIVLRRSDSQPFSLDNNPGALKIKLRVVKTINTVPVIKTYVYGAAPLADETSWDEEFAAPSVGAERVVFNVKNGQSHFTEDSSYNIQLLALEGVSYAAEGSPRVYFSLPAGVTGVLNIKAGSTTKTSTPIISPAGGLHISARTVSISCSTAGALIYYTQDGSQPTVNSNQYSGSFIVERTLTIKAIALKAGLDPSETATAIFTIKCAAPVFEPAGGAYDTARQVIISCATPGVRIYYTENGSQPSETSGTLYSTPVSVASSRTIKAVAVKNGALSSDTASATYNITPASKTAQPVFYPAPGSYSAAQSVTITCATPAAVIRYTTDGSDPLTSSSSSIYSAPVLISVTTTLKAAAQKEGNEDSNITAGLYTIKAAAPSFNPPAGTYSGAQQVIISTATAGASIYYTTDGTEPTVAGSLYNGAVTVSESLVIKAIAVKTGLANSDVAPAAYSISQIPAVSPVTFSPAGGSFIGGGQTITLSCATAGAAIRYTLDGADPAAASGAIYSAPFTLSAPVTVKAIAYKSGMLDSAVSSAIYRFVPKVNNVRFDAPTKILRWDAVSVPGSAAVKYYVNGTASAFGMSKPIDDNLGTTETSLNATGLIPDEYAGIPINVSINVTAAAVKPGGGEVRGEKSDQCDFTVTK
jgi:hypothetical protein